MGLDSAVSGVGGSGSSGSSRGSGHTGNHEGSSSGYRVDLVEPLTEDTFEEAVYRRAGSARKQM